MQRKSVAVPFAAQPSYSVSSRRAVGLTILLLLLALASSMIGCGAATTSSQRQPRTFEGQTLRVSCPGNPAVAVIQRYSQSWSLQTGARVELVHYDAEKGPDVGSAADLWVIPPARMPHWAAAGQLHEVPAAITAEGASFAWDRIVHSYQKLLTWNRKVYALPLLGEELLCFYREDLLQNPSIRADYRKRRGSDLPAPGTGPRTWQEFADIAEYFNKQKRPGLDRPVASLPPLPAGDDDLDREFYAVVVPFAQLGVHADDRRPPPDDEMLSFHYDLATGQARINTPGFRSGLEMLKRLQACRPAGEAADPVASFQKGEAVFCLAGPACISRFVNEPGLQGKWGYCRPPGSRVVFDYRSGQERAAPTGNFVPYLGAKGWVSVVPSSNAAPQAAFALAATLADPQTSRDIVIEPEWGGGVFRREHLDSRAGWRAFGLDDGTENLVETLRQLVLHPQFKNPVTRLRIPDERDHQLALLHEVRASLLRGKEPAQALADAAQRWQALDAKKDPKQRRLQYRLSLGLSSN
jgi:ABC-type glycerol-3-phosphate transport system substrate-binding protein